MSSKRCLQALTRKEHKSADGTVLACGRSDTPDSDDSGGGASPPPPSHTIERNDTGTPGAVHMCQPTRVDAPSTSHVDTAQRSPLPPLTLQQQQQSLLRPTLPLFTPSIAQLLAHNHQQRIHNSVGQQQLLIQQQQQSPMRSQYDLSNGGGGGMTRAPFDPTAAAGTSSNEQQQVAPAAYMGEQTAAVSQWPLCTLQTDKLSMLPNGPSTFPYAAIKNETMQHMLPHANDDTASGQVQHKVCSHAAHMVQ
jgi:hypothetical protein